MKTETDPQIEFTQVELRAEDGRKIVGWRLRPAKRRPGVAPLLIAGGFGRAMHHFGAFAFYFAYNGFETYRFDYVDHVGLSDGEFYEFTLSTGLSNLRTAIDWVRADSGAEKVGLMTMSLSSLIALEYAASHPDRVAHILTAVGVVDLRRTVAIALEGDYLGMPRDELPRDVFFQRLALRARGFYDDAVGTKRTLLETTVGWLKKIPCPIVNFAALDDTWVDPEDVRKAFELGDGGPRRMYRLLDSGHEFGKNLSAARTFLLKSTETLLELNGYPGEPVDEPSFEAITMRALEERRLQRAHRPEGVRRAPAAEAGEGA